MADYTDESIEAQAQENVRRRRELMRDLAPSRERDRRYDQEYYAREQRRDSGLYDNSNSAGPVTILRGGKAPESVQGFSKGGMVRKHGSPTDCGPYCRDSKTIRR